MSVSKSDPYPSYKINGVQVTIQPGSAEHAKILLRGRTYDHREKIKSLGGTWDAATKTWALPPKTDVTWLQPPPPPPVPVLSARDAYQMSLARSRKKFHGPCCSRAVCYESRPYGPLCYRCETHGDTINDYCGD
jgi:hypothetical protein